MDLNLRSLINRLHPNTRESLESASAACVNRNNPEVELEHWLFALLNNPDVAFHTFCQRFNLDTSRWLQTLDAFLDELPRDHHRRPTLSRSLITGLQQAWLFASLECQQQAMESPHLIGALLREPRLRELANSSCRELLGKVNTETAEQWIAQAPWRDGLDWPENGITATDGDTAPASERSTPNLDRYTENLTERAKQQRLDAIVGRDQEIRQTIDILIRRRQNNPILTGEAGVGKTAVVEGLAQRIARGEVPATLRAAAVHSLDLGLLQAGASVRGEFEKRLKGVIEDIERAAHPILLFVDEAHTLIGAGGEQGQNDASNLLKPALARGELRTIAATTWREYKKYFESDPALTRRFQVVHIEEPTLETATDMMRALAESLRTHHGVSILEEAVTASVQLSARYISGRQLPDKAVSLLDTACARVSLSQSITPGELEDRNQQLERIEEKRSWLARENLSSGVLSERISQLEEQLQSLDEERNQLDERWKREQALVAEISELRRFAEDGAADEKEAAPLQRLRELNSQLDSTQGDAPLVHPVVDRQAVAAVVAQWTGIPVGQMVRDEIHALLSLGQRLEQRVHGQWQAIQPLVERIQSSRSDLTEPEKPVGVFLLIGPSGTGKTETALTLSEELYGGEQNLTIINMSEFKEEHKVSMLLGSPPGYVGYGEGGVLTEAVRRKPYSVVLLDEMEKAHSGIQDVFYSILDKGTARDGEGRDIDFRNTVIIMTSNACDGKIKDLTTDDPNLDSEKLMEGCQTTLRDYFKPAFLGRTTVIPYRPLQSETLNLIAKSRLDRLQQRIENRFAARLSYDDSLPSHLAQRSMGQDTGARYLDNIISTELLPQLARLFLSAQADRRSLPGVFIRPEKDCGYDIRPLSE